MMIGVRIAAESSCPTKHGSFRLVVYDSGDGKEHLALCMGDLSDDGGVLVRVHSECLTGDIFHSERCDCGEQLEKAMEMIGKEKRGVIVYLRQEGRGIGLVNKIKAYALQDKGMDTVEANEELGFKPDMRDYTVGARILADLGVKNIRLLTNNPRKIEGLEKLGLKIIRRVPIVCKTNKCNEHYIRTKIAKLGHMIDLGGYVVDDGI